MLEISDLDRGVLGGKMVSHCDFHCNLFFKPKLSGRVRSFVHFSVMYLIICLQITPKLPELEYL